MENMTAGVDDACALHKNAQLYRSCRPFCVFDRADSKCTQACHKRNNTTGELKMLAAFTTDMIGHSTASPHAAMVFMWAFMW